MAVLDQTALLDIALEAVEVANDWSSPMNLGGDTYQFHEVATGQFTNAVDVWSAFKSVLDDHGGSQWLEELGIWPP